MDFGQQRNPGKHVVGIGVVLGLHLLLGWALVSGLAQRMVEVIKAPIEASVHTIITRKSTAPVLFDETPVGLRRRRTMVEAMQRLDALVPLIGGADPGAWAPALDAICAVVLYDYQRLRYGEQPWLPQTPRLAGLAEALGARPSVANTRPYVA